ncbi:MAG: hypothetical protein JW863_09400 [Chitinispirillaceae bacterium]|nr:hypothetical protein [Chitinispirillaceae bacterium]
MFKKVLLTGCILLLSIRSYGEVSLGINLTSDLITQHNQQNSNNDNSSTTYTFGIQPQVLILVSDFIEVAPFAGFNTYRYVRYNNSDQTSESTSFGFNFGCGLFFHVAGNEIIRFSIGPEINYGMSFPDAEDQFTLYTGVDVPANIDLCFNNHFFMRLSPVLAGIDFTHQSNSENNYTNEFNFYIITQTGASLGFFFTF